MKLCDRCQERPRNPRWLLQVPIGKLFTFRRYHLCAVCGLIMQQQIEGLMEFGRRWQSALRDHAALRDPVVPLRRPRNEYATLTVTCPECRNRQTLARHIVKPGDITFRCHGCEAVVIAQVTAPMLRAAGVDV